MRTKKLFLATAVVAASVLFAANALAHHRPEHNGGGKPSPSPSESPTPEPSEEPTLEPSEEPTLEPSEEPTLEPSPSPTEEPAPQEPAPQEPAPQEPRSCHASDTSAEPRPYPYYTVVYSADCGAVPRSETLAASGIFLPPPAHPHFCLILGCGYLAVPGVTPGWGRIVVEIEAGDGTRTEVCRRSGVPPVTCSGVLDVVPGQPVRCLATAETYLGGLWITRLEVLCG